MTAAGPPSAFFPSMTSPSCSTPRIGTPAAAAAFQLSTARCSASSEPRCLRRAADGVSFRPPTPYPYPYPPPSFFA